MPEIAPEAASLLANAFDDDYLFFHEAIFPDDRNEAETELAKTLLSLRPDETVLDLCCGYGRIANRLARDGMRVRGIDLSEPLLERARADARRLDAAVDYRVGDAAALPYAAETFDAIVCWFTSFGLTDDETSQRILSEAARVLRPGGRIGIELANRDYLMSAFQAHNVVERDGDFMIDRNGVDVVSGHMAIDRSIVRGGRVTRRSIRLRLFTPPEIREWLASAGLVDAAVLDENGRAFSPVARAMIVVARRAE